MCIIITSEQNIPIIRCKILKTDKKLLIIKIEIHEQMVHKTKNNIQYSYQLKVSDGWYNIKYVCKELYKNKHLRNVLENKKIEKL